MSFVEPLGIVIFLAVVWYWLISIRAREIVLAAGRHTCKARNVIFLDDTVEQTRIRPQRNPNGRLVFYREYRFEFASDGAYRYHGSIKMLGHIILSIEMDAYREDSSVP